MERLFDGVYIASITHTGYCEAIMYLAVITGIFAIVFSIAALIIYVEQDGNWRKIAIASLILISVCAAFAMEANKHSDDIGGYKVYITQDADINELLSQYRVIGVQGNFWTIRPADDTRESLE